jgi:peptidoglycan/LPS O-acetylase OafA/YrhL
MSEQLQNGDGPLHAGADAIVAEAPETPAPQAAASWRPVDRGRIPSLDGLRAISILFVIVGHASATLPRVNGTAGTLVQGLISLIGNGEMGVTVFFVLSGFLITTLLLKELRKTGGLSIKNFYIRRAFRIWPAFYLMIAVVVMLGVIKAIPLTTGEVISASLFYWNYYPHGATWFLGHTWSLAVEEQFYVVWPLLLKFLGAGRAAWFAAGVIAIEPAVRVANYAFAPSMRSHIGIMGHTRADSLMLGALAALLYTKPNFQNFVNHLFARHLPLVGGCFLIFVDPILEEKFRGSYMLPVGFLLQSLIIALIMLWAIQNSGRWFGRVLNSQVAVHVGLISYSLYLWQQIFLGTQNKTFTGIFPLNIVCVFAVAECSYWFIERSFLAWRKRFVPDA